MRQHYLKVLDFVQPYAQTALRRSQDWQQVLAADLCVRNSLSVVDVPFYEGSERPVGICGKNCFALAVPDKDRNDSLFVIRVEGPRSLEGSRSYQASLALSTGACLPSERLDPVDGLFALFEQGGSSELPSSEGTTADSALNRILWKAPPETLEAWSPRTTPSPLEDKDLLEALRALWARHRLDRVLRPGTQRVTWMLAGRSSPYIDPLTGRLDPATRRALLEPFSLDSLESAAHIFVGNGSTFLQVLGDLAELPVPVGVRLSVWARLAAGLEPGPLRRELNSCVSTLDSLQGEALREATGQAVVAAIARVAATSGDSILIEKALQFDAAPDPLLAVTEWSGELLFSTPEESPSPEDEASSPASPPFPKQAGVDVETLEGFKNWVLSLRFPNPETLVPIVEEVERVLNVPHAAGTPVGFDRLEQIGRHLQAIAGALPRWEASLPTLENLHRDMAEARASIAKARPLLGSTLGRFLERRVTPSDLTDIAALLEHREILELLPRWIWDPSALDSASKGLTEADLLRLEDPALRSTLAQLVSQLRTAPLELVKPLRLLPAPQGDEDRDTYVTEAVERQLASSLVLTNADPRHHQWIRAAQEEGVSSQRLGNLLEQVGALLAGTSDQVWLPLASDLATETDQDRRERLVGRLLRAARLLGPAAHVAPYQVLKQVPVPDAGAESGVLAEVDHNFVDRSGKRATLYYQQYPDDSYGYVVVPLKLRARNARPLKVELRYELSESSELTKAWPAIRRRPSPERLDAEERHWRKDGDNYAWSFELRIPIRRPPNPEEGEEPLEISLSATDPASGTQIVPTRKLRWDRVLQSSDPLELDWPDRIEPEWVKEHPVGPQRRLKSILTRLRGGSSFAVVAPRRFGKSTLADSLALVGEEKAEKLAIPRPIACGRNVNQRGPERSGLWREVDRRLEAMFVYGMDSHVPESNYLPSPGAFDTVRRRAKQKGYSAIVIVFDEAQRFFPRRGGSVGDDLKDLLEQHWSKETPEMSRLLFGFIGLPSLQERWGSQLETILGTERCDAFPEDELNRIILHMTQRRLETTREARELLKQRSQNLFILKDLLRRLVEQLNYASKTWADHDDAQRAYATLKTDVSHPRHSEIRNYVRDVLNEAESPSLWEPRPAYPMAVALAAAHVEHSGGQALQFARERLNDWCNVENAAAGARRLEYSMARIEEHLATLENLGLYARGDGFTSDLLATWLRTEATRFPTSQADLEVLLRGALERVRLPDTYEPVVVGRGSEAEIYRFNEGGQTYALRRVPLPNRATRLRFQEGADALSALRERLGLKEESSQFVYQLRSVGLSEESDAEGLQIYPWVEGQSLDAKLGQLAPPLVAEVGWKLARGLRFVHRLNVIHRDIRPANIILADPDASPVLIDFGMARLDDSRMGTVVSNPEYAAPEVQRDPPDWDRPADVYSLGVVLKKIMQSGPGAEEIHRIVARCISSRPADRPSAEELVDLLEKARGALRVDERVERINAEIGKILAVDESHDWFLKQVFDEKVRAGVIAAELGLEADAFSKCVTVANLLHHVLEAKWSISLGKLRHERRVELLNLHDAVPRAVTCAVRLRNYRSHSGKASREDILVDLGRPTDEQLVGWVVALAKELGKVAGLSSLEPLALRVTGRREGGD